MSQATPLTFRATALAAALALISLGASAQNAGDRDLNFDGDGIRFIERGLADGFQAVAPGPAASAYAAGSINMSATQSDYEMTVAKVLPTGALDTTFGGGDGLATVGFPGNDGDEGFDVVVQRDGKIVVVGEIEPTAYSDFGVARFTAAGLPDPTFGDVLPGGTARSGFRFFNVAVPANDGPANDGARAVAMQGDKILVAGLGIVNEGSRYPRFALVRLNADGSTDNTFANNTGRAIATPITPNNSEYLSAIARRIDGSLLPTDPIILVGFSNSRSRGLVRRYTPDGVLDTTFGTAGTLVFSSRTTGGVTTGMSTIDDAALLPDGKILVTGTGNDRGMVVVRLNPNGSLDGTFGTNGRVNVNFGDAFNYDESLALAVQRNGKIVIAGHGNVTPTTTEIDFTVARLLPNGQIDTRFGIGGKVTWPLSTSADEARGVAVLTDGAIMAAGYASRETTSATNLDPALLRLYGDDELFRDGFE